MQIIRIDESNLRVWKYQIIQLLDESIRINFSDYLVSSNYCNDRCNKIEGYIKDGTAIIYAAVHENELRGWIWCHEIHRLNKTRLHIAEIAVLSKYRGKGIGKKLLKTVESYAEENGYYEIDLLVSTNNMDAIMFYKGASYTSERYLMKKVIKR